MVSNDNVIVEIDGREYAVISGRLEAIERENGEMHKEVREIHAEIRTLSEELHMLMVRVNAINDRIDDMKFYVSLTFTAIAVFVGLFAVVPIVGKIIDRLKRPAISEERISAMIKEGISQALAGR